MVAAVISMAAACHSAQKASWNGVIPGVLGEDIHIF
jgi:hypothetical protein